MISETKIDDSFPIGNFLLDEFSTTFQPERDAHRGGIILYVKEDIRVNLLVKENVVLDDFYVELNL